MIDIKYQYLFQTDINNTGDTMMIEKGVIESTSQQKTMVRVQKSSACAGCSTRNSCHTHDNQKDMVIEVINNLDAKSGDLVEISVPTGSFLKLTLIVYFLPVVALVIGAYIGGELADYLSLSSTLSSVLFGAVAMGLTFFILRSYDQSANKTGQYRPQIIRIIAPA